MPSSNRDRLVGKSRFLPLRIPLTALSSDVCEELIKTTVLLRPHRDLLDDRYSEREEKREHGRLRTQAETEAAKVAEEAAKNVKITPDVI
jgi:arsenic resistance protein ArsH